MADPRVERMAMVLARYSLELRPGNLVSVEGSELAAPLLRAFYQEAVRAGAHPLVRVALTGLEEDLLRLASDAQLTYTSPLALAEIERLDAWLRISAPANTRALSGADPARLAARRGGERRVVQRRLERAAAGDLNWCGTLFPTPALAQEAEMSLSEYEDFVYGAGLLDEADPVAAWRQTADEVNRLTDWLQGREEVHITAPGTDLWLNVAERTFVPCVGEHNMPDGEFFTGPVEDSVEGEVAFSFPATYGGREVAGVRLRFEEGEAVEASADSGEEFLLEMLDADDGARRLGELGIGTNYGISTATKEILLDEKIGGTVHMAIGMSYPETGGQNESAVHWDMVLDLRRGGSIVVDGVELQRDGRFVV